jgi:hypothetical protein
MPIDYEALKRKILDAANECAERGAGYAQQKAVFDAIVQAYGGDMSTRLDLDLQQAILTCWHDLFREGTISWGLNLDNPDPPFFHIPVRPRR